MSKRRGLGEGVEDEEKGERRKRRNEKREVT